MNFSLDDKQLSSVKSPVLLILTVVFSFAMIPGVQAQVERPVRPPAGQLPAKRDTIRPPLADSLQIKNDTLSVKSDSTKTPPKKDIETTIFYSATDSINSDMQRKIIKLYGNAKIKYGTIELEAERIVIDYEASTITANGVPDSTGRDIGLPIFKDGGQVYETHDMVYNFKTKRAQISEVVTKQGEGFIHGDRVYKNNKNELFSINNAYTTCDLAHPHFRIISRKSKAIPGDKIVSGPFYMEFMDVPTPLGFAFGIFPQTRKSQSGIIMPTYGEEKTRGFFLRGGGYYFDISDYFKLGIMGDLYSKGSSGFSINSLYRKRYKYTGSIMFNFTSNRFSQNIENNDRIKDFRLTWSHSPQTRGTGRFSASVNAATSSFTTNNYVSMNSAATSSRIDQTSRKLSSTISYSKSYGQYFSYGLNLRHNQDLFTKQIDLPLPDLSASLNNVYPFKNSKSKTLQNINIKIQTQAINNVTNKVTIKRADGTDSTAILPFNGTTFPTLFKNGNKGVRHTLPLGTSFTLFKYFTFNPSVSFTELWYFDKLNWKLNPEGTLPVIADTVKGFNRVTNYNGSISFQTRIYGMWINKNKQGRVKAIRHVVNPSVGYTFAPDFGAEKYGYWQTFTLEDGTTIQKSRHENFVYGSSATGRQGAMSFGLNNTVEMKVRGKKDTVDRKVMLLNQLSINSSYNFLKDSMQLSPFNFSAATNVLDGKLNINVGGTIDPYQWILGTIDEKGNVTQKQISRYTWEGGAFRLGQLRSVNVAIGTNLSPKGREKDKTTQAKIANATDISTSDKEYMLRNPDQYVDFSIPWNLRVNYTVLYNKNGYQKSQVTQTLRFNGDLSVTEKWKIDFNSGYDFQAKAFTQSNFGIRRDLHCWQMSLNWVPFGRFQSYNFSIGIKSGMLRDLKLDRQRNFIDQL